MPIQPPLNRRNHLLLARAVWRCEPTSFVSQGFAAEDLEWGGSLGHLNLSFSSIDLNSEFRRHCGMRFEPFWAAHNASRGMQQGKSLTASLAYFPSLPVDWKNQRGINGLGPFLWGDVGWRHLKFGQPSWNGQPEIPMMIFRPCEINYQRKHPTRVSFKSPLILATENCTELLDSTLPGQHRMPWLTNRFIQIFPDCCGWNPYDIYSSMSHISWSTYRPSTAGIAYHVLVVSHIFDGSALYFVSHCRIIYPIVSQHWQNIPLLIAFIIDDIVYYQPIAKEV